LDLSELFGAEDGFVYMNFNFTGAGPSDAPQEFEYWFDYDNRNNAGVTNTDDSFTYPPRWSEGFEAPNVFNYSEQNGYDTLEFKLRAPEDDGTYDAPVVEVEVYDGDEQTPNTVVALTPSEGVYSYTPEKNNGYVVRVWWSQAEKDYAEFQPGEGEIAVEISFYGSDSATITSDTLPTNADKYMSIGGLTKYILSDDTTSVDLTITPGEGEWIRRMNIGPNALVCGEDFIEEADGEAVTYTWDISDEGNRFCEVEIIYAPGTGEWYTVSYGGANVQVDNGQVIIERVRCNDYTFTTFADEVDEQNNILPATAITGGNSDFRSDEYDPEEDLLRKYHVVYSEGDVFIDMGTEGVEIDYKFIPDYGYQVTDIRVSETESLLENFNPNNDVISEFTFTPEVDRNAHFFVEFTKTDDIVDFTGAVDVNGVTIENGENAATTGNLSVTVVDTEVDNTIDNAVSTFGITLDNVVSMTGENGNWTTNITEFDDPITLTVALDTDVYTEDSYTVVREHEGEKEEIDSTYNPETGELSFETNRFSLYTVVEKEEGNITPPTAKTDLTYTGKAQVLVNAGASTSGTVLYKIGEGEYSSQLPTATNAGNYTVYYMVEGNDEYKAVPESSITVTIASPKMLEGENQVIDLTKTTTASFRSEAPFSEFVKVQVDGKDVDAKYYDAKEGSTIITLKEEFLKSLSNGKHEISIVSKGATADCEFTVSGNAVAQSPATGDNSNIVLLIALLGASAVAIVVVVILIIKKKKN